MRKIIALALLVGFSACSNKMAPQSISEDSTSAVTPAGDSVPDNLTNPTESRKVSYRSNLTMEVDDLKQATSLVRRSVKSGYVAQEKVATTWARWELKVLPNELDSVLAELKELGRVLDFEARSEDLTIQITDTASQVLALSTLESRLLELSGREPVSLDSLLRIEQELARVRGEKERILSIQETLKRQVAYATIEIQMTQKYEPAAAIAIPYGWKVLDTLKSSAKNLLSVLESTSLVLVALIPWLPIWFMIFFIFVFVRKRIKNSSWSF